MPKDCSCVDNCSEHCNSVGSNITNTDANPIPIQVEAEGGEREEAEVNGNNTNTSIDEINTLDTNNNAERYECAHILN